MTNVRHVLLLALVTLFTCKLWAQTSSGTVLGRLTDSQGLAIPVADLALVSTTNGDRYAGHLTSNGDFVIADVKPGTYTLVVRAQGFKELRKTNLALTASERLSAGTLVLQVGAEDQSISVSADITPVQTTSSERSGLLETKQMENLLSIGRDAMSLVRTLPGVVGSEGVASLGVETLPTVNGIRSEYNTATVDGVAGNTRGQGSLDTPTNIDAIAEVKVLTSNYQAEYGRAAGAVINIVTKNGTSKFHGAAYYYVRNEALNANTYFNNRNGLPRASYRYNTIGGNVGGPIFWPKRFNPNRSKLFFFVSAEYLPIVAPDGIKYYTVPTAAERIGDFSQTFIQGVVSPTASNQIYIKDPSSTLSCTRTGTATAGPGCFPGNKLPPGAINASTQALLNIMPLPNYTNRGISAGNYNYITNYSANNPVNQEIARVDYDPSERVHMYGRIQLGAVNNNGYASAANKLPWLMRVNYKTTNPNYAFNLTWTINPTVVNELTVGHAAWTEAQVVAASDLAKITKSATGYSLGQNNPANNPLNLVPAASFGGVTNAATFSYDPRFPISDDSSSYSLTDGLTKVWGQHTVKVGADLQTDSYLQSHSDGSGALFPGSFAFDYNVNNPNESNYAYSNALLGNFNTYTEPNVRLDFDPRTNAVEWYGQDQWRATHKLTIDYGVRFTLGLAQTLKVGANFVPSRYVAGGSPTLYNYAKVAGKAVAVDPATGLTYPAAYAGLFVPNTGNIANGDVTTTTPGYPSSLIYGTGVLLAPRVGFAYDAFGDGKTAIRGGFGIFYNARARTGQEGDMTFNPPAVEVPEQFYGNANTFTQSAGLLGPSAVNHAIVAHPSEVTTYNASLGIQQNIGYGIIMDTAYVGTFGRHLSDYVQINEVPFGAHFLPQNQSPAGGVLPDNFFRPYPGYGSIPMEYFNLTSSYNSLQSQLTRRFRGGLAFGVVYTWSKAMDYTDSYTGTIATYVNPRIYNYGPAGYDRRNNLTFNYVWDLPKASKLHNDFATRWILDNWQLSGIGSFISGSPLSFSLTLSDGQDVTGGGDPLRPFLTGNPNVGAPRTFGQWFNTSVVHRPTVLGSWGNAPFAPVNGPGIDNWDTALFKNIPVAESVLVQFRLETYNTFNHTQFSSINTAATFNAAGTQTNATFGQVTGTQNPRYVQLAARINF